MCHFPTDVKYKNEIPPFPDGNGRLVGTAKSMYRRLKDLNIVDERFLDGVGDINDLERIIFSLIDGYPDNKASLERIFHMIEIWGGKEGYQFYYKQQFEWKIIGPLYKQFIDTCRTVKDVSEESRRLMFDAINAFHNGLHGKNFYGMGIAFITKHSRFWMHRNLNDNMLPIYDSKLSNLVMGKNPAFSEKDLQDYWSCMIDKADFEHISLAALERILFQYRNTTTKTSGPHALGTEDGIIPVDETEKILKRPGNHALFGFRFHRGAGVLFLYVGEYDTSKRIFCQILPKKWDGSLAAKIHKVIIEEDPQFEYKPNEGRHIKQFKIGEEDKAKALMESLTEPIARAIWGDEADKYLHPENS